MERNPEEELFERLAVAIGETLEDVWRMPDVERMQLIEVLGLGQVARPVAEEDVGQGGHHEVTVADATKGVGQEDGHKEQECGPGPSGLSNHPGELAQQNHLNPLLERPPPPIVDFSLPPPPPSSLELELAFGRVGEVLDATHEKLKETVLRMLEELDVDCRRIEVSSQFLHLKALICRSPLGQT